MRACVWVCVSLGSDPICHKIYREINIKGEVRDLVSKTVTVTDHHKHCIGHFHELGARGRLQTPHIIVVRATGAKQ